jgi:Fe-S-cluster containining protein
MSNWVTDLDFIAQAAQEKREDNAAFAYYVELDERSDSELDARIEALAAPIIAGIDCTQCGNCCRNLQVYLTPPDAEALAAGLFIPLSQVQDRYLDLEGAAEEGEWARFRARPCAFLAGKRCSIYPHRPESCRAYPEFTPDFRWQAEQIMGGYGLCPIIYNLIEVLKHDLQW